MSKLNARHLFRYRFGFIRGGKRYLVTDWKPNLILDTGLNMIGGNGTADCINTCLFGNAVSPTPVRRNSGAVTVSQAANTLTASGNFFVAGDVGRLWKFDTGEEVYITAFTSGTVVTCGGPPQVVGASPGTVWYVNETALDSLYSTTSTYGASGGDNGTTAAANVVTRKRTYVGPAVAGAPVTLTEIGFSSGAANVNIFDRDIITGGVTLAIGDQPLAVAELITTYEPGASTAVGNVATGFDSSGDMVLAGLNAGSAAGAGGIQNIQTNGNADNAQACTLEPCFVGGPSAVYSVNDAAFALPPFSNGLAAGIGSHVTATSVNYAAYVNGNFFKDFTIGFTVASAIGNIFGVYASNRNNGGSPAWIQKFTTPFAKSGLQTLSFTFRFSWQRILAN